VKKKRKNAWKAEIGRESRKNYKEIRQESVKKVRKTLRM
jgi:hypothetical protein